MNRQAVDISTEEFLSNFFNAEDTIHILAIKEGEGRNFPKAIDFKLAEIDGYMERLEQLNNEGHGLYFTVNHGGTKDAEITRINAFYMEIDDVSLDEQWKRITEFPLLPSIVVYSGSKSYHTYWLVRDAEVKQFRDIQTALIHRFQADHSIKNEARRMRLPGFLNCKSSNKKRSEIVYYSSTVYSQAEIRQHVTVIDISAYEDRRPKPKVNTEFTPKKYINHTGNAEFDIFRDMIASKLETDYYIPEGNKTTCCCILPEHNDSRPSAVFFWDTNTYYCPVCDISIRILDVLKQSGDFDEEVKYAKQHGIYNVKTGDDDKDIAQIGCSFNEYLKEVEYEASRIKGIDSISAESITIEYNGKPKEIAEKAAQATIDTLNIRNSAIKESHKLDIRNISMLLAYPYKLDKITAISGQPGFAKTTLLMQFIKTACEMDSTFGAVVVCRTKNDMKQYADYFNGNTDINGLEIPYWALEKSPDRIAYVMESWNSEKCLAKHKCYTFGMCWKESCNKWHYCGLMKQYGMQKQYPIVITTHERMLMDSEEAGRFIKTYGTWGSFENEYNRRVIVIDEKPELIKTTLIDHNTICKLVGRVKEVSLAQKLEQDEYHYYAVKEVEELYSRITAIAGERDTEAKFVDISKLIKDSSPKLKAGFSTLKKFVKKYVGLDEFKLITEIEQMFINGFAVVTTHHGIEDKEKNWQIASARWRTLDIEGINTFILDGTSDISPDYADPERFQRYDCDNIRSYSNWTIHHVNTSFSKNKLSGRYESISEVNKRIAIVVKDYIIPDHKKTLIVTLKNNVNALSSQLRSEINAGRVTVAYDGNLIGTNEYKDFTAIAFTSHIEFPPAIIEATEGLIELSTQRKDGDLDGFYGIYKTFRYKNRHYYELPIMEAVRLLKTAENMVQGALRIDRDPNSIKKVALWILDRNAKLCDLIQKKLPESIIQTEEIDELKVRRSTASTYILHDIAFEAIKQSIDGKLAKYKLAELAGIKADALTKNLQRADVKERFADLGLKISKWYIEPA